MHDFESQVFDALASGLESRFEGIRVVSEPLPGEPQFPLVQFTSTDLTPDERSAESGDMEPRSVQLFEAQCYSNRSRREAKAIAAACDELMGSWGWRRTAFMQVENQDRTIRRYVARWRGSVDADGMVAR